MGFTFRKSKRLGRSTTASVSKSGPSVSQRAGRISVSSRGRGAIRLGKGLGFRFKL